jgi:hypothetical protein
LQNHFFLALGASAGRLNLPKATISWPGIAGALGAALASRGVRGLTGGLLFVGDGGSGTLACLPHRLKALEIFHGARDKARFIEVA